MYKGINLGYDPYEIKNIDEKGKSYLKISSNTKKPNFISLRKKYKQSFINQKLNEKIKDLIKDTNISFILGMIFNVFTTIIIIFFFLKGKDKKDTCFCKCCNFMLNILYSLLILLHVCILVVAFQNIKKINEIREIAPKEDYDFLKKLYIIFINICFLLDASYIGLLIDACYYKCKNKNKNDNAYEDSNKTNNNIIADAIKQNQSTTQL